MLCAKTFAPVLKIAPVTSMPVAVVDILPEGLSLVHFFYDPELKKLTLGYVGSIKLIEYIKEM